MALNDGRDFKNLVVYQIYTRSFQDSNNDGIGDIPGIIDRLDYLEYLGVDVLWLSPFCSSPNKDNGYDVSDYRDVMAEFGTLEDLDRLIALAHERGIRIMMDLVMNHSSIEHPWFATRPEYYYWTDKPNNWDSYFHNTAWTWDEKRQQYYLHLFYPEQPDLNWENPELREEMHDIARFWIDRGIDAFRLDAIHHIGKPEGLPDAPEHKGAWRARNYRNTPRTHQYLREFRSKVLEGTGVFTVGETGGTTPKTSRLYVDRRRRELDMIFLFDHLYKLEGDIRNLPPLMKSLYRNLSPDGWNTLFLNNHDFPRHLSILGDDGELRNPSASAFALLLLGLWGTPFVYQGEEIGMTNVDFPSLDDYDCQAAKNHYYRALESGLDEAEAFALFKRRTRDNARTPMQWSDEPGAGFSSARPWLGINPNHFEINVESQKGVAGSILEHYRFLIALRKALPELRTGSLKMLPGGPDRLLAWERRGGRRFLMLVNASGSAARYGGKAMSGRRYRLLYSNRWESGQAEGSGPLLAAPPADPASRDLGWWMEAGAGPRAGETLAEAREFAPWEARIYVSEA